MTLTLDLGCFPLVWRPYRQQTVYKNKRLSIVGLKRLSTKKGQRSNQFHTPYLSWFTHYLNNFHRKPAISEFDWHFTDYSPVIPVSCNRHEFVPPPDDKSGFKLLINRSLSFGSLYFIQLRKLLLVFTTPTITIKLRIK